MFFILLTLFSSALFPSLWVLPISVFLAEGVIRKERMAFLWQALTAGCLLECIAIEGRFGIHLIACMLTAWIVSMQKRRFYLDRFYSLPLFTISFSFGYTLLTWFFFSFDTTAPFPLVPLICAPLADGIMALVYSSAPILWSQWKKREREAAET